MIKIAPDPESVPVSLGGKTFAVPRLNLGQIRRLVKHWDEFNRAKDVDAGGMFEHGIATAALVFERANPPLGDLDELECSPSELREATQAVLAFSGMIQKAGEAAAPTGEGSSKSPS